MTLFTDVGPLSIYSPVTLYLSPATRILTENPWDGISGVKVGVFWS